MKLWAVWCFTLEICRVPSPVCGSNTPPARALWLKNHWKLVSFLRFVACLNSTFRSQNTFDFLILGRPNMNHHLHYCRIWDFPFFVKISAPNKPSPYCHWSAARQWHEHCSYPVKMPPEMESEGIQAGLCYLAGEEHFTALQNFPCQVLYEMRTWKRREMFVVEPWPWFLRECFHLVLHSCSAAGNSRLWQGKLK